MKQKVIIRVSLNEQKLRHKALQIVVGFAGVESVSWGGKEREHVEVVGEGIDAVDITTLLRKKIGCAEVVSVSPVVVGGEGDKQKKVSKESTTPVTLIHSPLVWPQYHHPVKYCGNGTPAFAHVYPTPVVPCYEYKSTCSIL